MKTSAGILLFRRNGGKVEVLLAHSGGPFYAKKDNGAWTIPKGEVDPGEEAEEAAKREFHEETSFTAPGGEYHRLGEAKSSAKLNIIWAVEGDADVTKFKSNTFEMEWPPKSGQIGQYPECDRATWFSTAKAKQKLFKNQVVFVARLEERLGIVETAEEPSITEQTSLF